jgi:hypothetical protein
MSVSINGTSGLVFNDASTQNTAATGFGFKNRLFNGNMAIDQRATAVTAAGYTVDRWKYDASQSGKASVAQGTDTPAGYKNCVSVTSSSAYSVLSTDYFILQQRIEGNNVVDLNFGFVGASTVTLSFWVKSSLTGTFGGALQNSGASRCYPFSYTISAANTWEQKSITIAGDTTGTWLTTNGIGLTVSFGLGVGTTYSGTANAWAATDYESVTGATSVVGTNGATWKLTGVQLEKGSTATSFDYRPYGTELALCQRYYYKLKGYLNRVGGGYNQSTTESNLVVQFPVPMRTSPTSLETSGTAADYRIVFAGTSALCNVVPIFSISSTESCGLIAPVSSGMTTGQISQLRFESTNSYLGFPAEL